MLETQDLIDFSITTWYELFKHITIVTKTISIPTELLQIFKSNDVDYESVKETCNDDFLSQIKSIIKSFCKGTAFVKNNWHSPLDAKFISFGNSLQVSNIDDLITYFTASTIVCNDFNNDKYESFVLTFRPWLNIHPAAEFRCIVIHNVLRGITPRDWPTYYAHYVDDGPSIIKSLNTFFIGEIKDKFKRTHYIFDVILNYPDDVVLVDFGPLNNKSNLYAFKWNEIQPILNKNCLTEIAPVFRYLAGDMGIITKAEALQKILEGIKKHISEKK